MGLVRGHHKFEDHFTQIPNAWLRDTRLSYKARGLLAELMTHSIGFEVSRQRLARNGQDGDRAVRTAIAELEDAGYLKRSQSRSDGQRFSSAVWTTCDPTEPSVRFAPAGNAPAENSALKKTEEKKTEEKEKTYAQDELERDFLDFWSIYPRKENKVKAQIAFGRWSKTVDPKVIIAGATRYANDPNRVKQYTRNPEAWLNGGCWDDDPLPERILSAEEKAAKADAEKLARMERDKIRREEDAKQRELDRKAAEEARASVTRCEHDRVLVMCPVCSKQ